jgi:teichuronic acid biosynthesis glycosyltransferase TuaC
MPQSYYAVFRSRGQMPSDDEEPFPSTLHLIWWKPSWTNVFPPHHKTSRLFIFWLMSRLRLFRNDDYSVLILEDAQGSLVHRTFCIPAWFQFPFMRPNDIQLGDVFTTLAERRRHIGQSALRYCVRRLAKPGRDIYYVAQPVNLPSHKLALSSGLQFLSMAKKKPAKAIGYYSLIPDATDYSVVPEISDPHYSSVQIKHLVERSGRGASGKPAVDSRPMQILAVIPYSSSPTSMIFARRQMAALAARGHEVETFVLNNRRSVRALVAAIRDYRRRIRAFRPDVVHAHYGAMTSFFSVFAASGMAPVVVTFRGSDLNPVPSLPIWQVWPSHLLSNLSAIGASHLICVSAELRGRLWWGTKKAALIPTGVDTTKFFPGSRSLERASLGWSEETPVILFNAGHSPPVKRLDLAEQVVALVRASMPDLKFVVLGGEVVPDEIPKLMRASDCLLFTSDFEGSPTVVQEAMASNLPIVSVLVGDVPERLAGVSQSHIVDRNPAVLARAVVTVLRDRQRSNGFEIAMASLGNEPIVRAIEKVYAHLVANR